MEKTKLKSNKAVKTNTSKTNRIEKEEKAIDRALDKQQKEWRNRQISEGRTNRLDEVNKALTEVNVGEAIIPDYVIDQVLNLAQIEVEANQIDKLLLQVTQKYMDKLNSAAKLLGASWNGQFTLGHLNVILRAYIKVKEQAKEAIQ
jgi:hypothetical protein